MTTLLVPMGPIEFSPAETAVILAVLAAVALLACLPVSLPMAALGARSARLSRRSAFWSAAWYWACGTALTLAAIGAGFQVGLPGWAAVPLGYLPGFAVLWLLWRRQRTRGPGPVYGPGTTTPGGPLR